MLEGVLEIQIVKDESVIEMCPGLNLRVESKTE